VPVIGMFSTLCKGPCDIARLRRDLVTDAVLGVYQNVGEVWKLPL